MPATAIPRAMGAAHPRARRRGRTAAKTCARRAARLRARRARRIGVDVPLAHPHDAGMWSRRGTSAVASRPKMNSVDPPPMSITTVRLALRSRAAASRRGRSTAPLRLRSGSRVEREVVRAPFSEVRAVRCVADREVSTARFATQLFSSIACGSRRACVDAVDRL